MAEADATVVCQPWVAADELCCEGGGSVENCDGSSTPLVFPVTDADYALAASNLLFKRTCLRYPGVCEVSYRPCVDCRCNRSPCGCHGGYYTIDLASDYPVIAVTEVLIDGMAVDSGLYRLDDDWRIVRTDGNTWPVCNNLGLPTVGGCQDIVVSFTTGRTPPIELQLAARELACELKRACNADESCSLPDHVRNITRRGVEFELDDVTSLMEKGLTGNKIIDHALAVYGKCSGPAHFVDPLRVPRGVRSS